MELREALSQIHEIRRQMAQTERFVGYRSLTTAFTGIVAVVASGIQWYLQPYSIETYLAIWLTAAGISLAVVAAEMILRCRTIRSPMQTEATVLAAEQFMPALVAGGLLTFVLVQFAPGSLWMLPGLWAIIFSMGIFASRRFLPRGTSVVGAYYLLAGLFVIAELAEEHQVTFVLPAWTMIATFGVGQLLAAGVLYWSVERKR